MTKGLFLDFDGTLCDSLSAMRAAYTAFLEAAGATQTLLDFDEINGPPLRQVVTNLKNRHGLPQSIDTLITIYSELVCVAYVSARPADGASELLTVARNERWQTFVVTSAPGDQVRHWLDLHNFTAAVDGVVGSGDVVRGKPDPEPYRTALALSSSDAANCIAVEDSQQGARSALSAGIPTWLLASRAPRALIGEPGFLGALPNLSTLADRLAEGNVS